MTENEEKKGMKEEEKKDWRLVEIENLKEKFRRWRKILFYTSFVFLVANLINWFSPYELVVPTGILLLLFLFSFIGWYLTRSFKVIKAWEGAAIFRMDEHYDTIGSGWTLILWPLDKIIFEDVREREVNIKPQEVITEDGVKLTIDASVWYKIRDVASYILNIVDPYGSMYIVMMSALRNRVGKMTMVACITSREEIGKALKSALEEEVSKSDKDTQEGGGLDLQSQQRREGFLRRLSRKLLMRCKGERKEGWGIEITRVELPDLKRPEKVESAVHDKIAAGEEKEAIIRRAAGEAGGIRKVKDSLKEDEDAVVKFIGLEFIKTLKENSKYFFDLQKIPSVGKLFKEFSDKV